MAVFKSEREIFSHWRRVVCAQSDEPLTYREFGELIGKSGQQAKNYESGAQQPDPKTLNDWYTSNDTRLFTLAIEVMTLRGRLYMERQRVAGQSAMALPALMVVRS